ncbi:hypothetical protein HMPREF9617_01403 [Cutibacterium acnes HL056PA1]|nr:hypothetical protein HMPREF9617_01403 [Cutibacterium acnes HL056PA1]
MISGLTTSHRVNRAIRVSLSAARARWLAPSAVTAITPDA